MASQTPWSLPQRETLTRRVGVGTAAPGRPVGAPGAAPGKGHARVLPEAGSQWAPGPRDGGPARGGREAGEKVSQAPGLLSLGAPVLGALTPSSENAEAEGPGALCLTPG